MIGGRAGVVGGTDHTRTGQGMGIPVLVVMVSTTLPHTQTTHHHHLLLGGIVVAGVGTDNRDSTDQTETGIQVEVNIVEVTTEVIEDENKNFSDVL